jgi:hypothetical protein
MPKKTFTPEQIVGKLRQIEVLVSQGKTVPVACREWARAQGALIDFLHADLDLAFTW